MPVNAPRRHAISLELDVGVDTDEAHPTSLAASGLSKNSPLGECGKIEQPRWHTMMLAMSNAGDWEWAYAACRVGTLDRWLSIELLIIRIEE